MDYRAVCVLNWRFRWMYALVKWFEMMGKEKNVNGYFNKFDQY